MNNSIRTELKEHLINVVNEQMDADASGFEDLHYLAFNEDYYIIGYYQASEWLKGHEVSEFEAIADVIQWEDDVLGEVSLKAEDINSEKIVNLYVYIKGEELISELDIDLDDVTKEDLLTAIAEL